MVVKIAGSYATLVLQVPYNEGMCRSKFDRCSALLMPDSILLSLMLKDSNCEIALKQLEVAWEKVRTYRHLSVCAIRKLNCIYASMSSFITDKEN